MQATRKRIAIFTFVLSACAASALAQETNLTISAEGNPALVLKVPPGVNVTVSGNHTVLQNTETTFHLWSLANAKTTDEALPKMQEVIKGEFVEFKPTATNEMMIAGKPARHISGTGKEADDGDPGAAELVFFMAGKHVFAACAHGEFDDAARRSKVMMVLLKSAKVP